MEFKRHISFETLKFNTASGWLEEGQYALTERGDAYWVLRPGLKGGIPGKGLEKVPLDTDMSGLKEVQIVGHTAYNEFLVEDKVVQEEITLEEYRKWGTVRDYPAPTKSLTQEEIDIIKTSEERVTKL